ncbi:hypothetical protein J2S74_002956 [Evansella vedderi]|uniref:Uncharacterized protein n=1 Tax=Evansella vedderi TaxID=38282 RepID=A0ABT9ZWH1_9BACI|nr:hypothetical protein [Evansella vedderi]MDQ0255574.1 hypothetical protein [Evansella vedderi]
MKHFWTLFITIIVLTAILSGCNRVLDDIDDVTINNKIIQYKDFHVKSESTELDTSVRGTVFLYGEEVPEHAQIIALIEIDPDDWGGVAFYIPEKWNISNVTSSYPEEKNEEKPENYIAIWNTESERYELTTMIEIGTGRNYIPTGGGKGAIIIDLDINKATDISTSDIFNIIVEVGSEEKDGIRSIRPDYEFIEISAP